VGLAVALWRRTGPGKRFRYGATNLYCTPAVTSDEAERVGRYLVRQKYTETRVDARLTRDGVTYQFQLISPPGRHDPETDAACEVLAAGLSGDVFGGAPVEVHVCDEIFRPRSVVPHRGRFGRRLAMNAAHLFYLEGVTDSQALEVATFLAGVGLFNDAPKIAQMNRSADGYEFRLAVEVDPLTPEMVEGERQMAGDLSRVLGGARVAVHFRKGLVATLRAVTPGGAGKAADAGRVSGGPYRTKVFLVPGDLPGDGSVRAEENGEN
jgi:hypothetical protein